MKLEMLTFTWAMFSIEGVFSPMDEVKSNK